MLTAALSEVPAPLLTAFVFVLGAAVGSFLNVVIHRIPRGESVVRPRSRCPGCGASIPALANVPILSWFLLRGRCRDCGMRIPFRYPLVEGITALLFVALWLDGGPTLTTLVHGAVGAALIAVAFIDGEHRIIPNSITVPGILLGLAFAAVSPSVGLLDAAFGVVFVGGAMWGLSMLAEWWYGRIALGLGDVKLVAMMGAFLGLQPAIGVVALGSFFGVAQAGVWMVLGRAGRKTAIPFGPSLAAAGILHLLAPDALPRLLRALPGAL
jgi:leader peptidase (prepilin peptidase)/N-methyltransferase